MGKKAYDEFLSAPLPTSPGRDEFDLGPLGSRAARAATELHGGFQGDSDYDAGLTPYSNQNTVRARNQPWTVTTPSLHPSLNKLWLL